MTEGRLRPSKPGLSPRVRGNLFSCQAADHIPRTIPACAGEPPSTTTGDGGMTNYPRVCGGTAFKFCFSRLIAGLSPRVRGNLKYIHIVQHQKWTIPACAGEPSLLRYRAFNFKDYPRVCGGTHKSYREE